MEKAAFEELKRTKQCLDEMRFFKALTLVNWEDNDVIVEIVKKLK